MFINKKYINKFDKLSSMQENVQVGEAVTVQVTRAFRIDWTLVIAILFILAIIYFLYKRRGGKKMDFKKIVIAVVIGFVFAFIAFALSGDNSSIVIGLLIIYLELRFGGLVPKEKLLFKERRIKK